jgi:dsRNA-specific ribonuclease
MNNNQNRQESSGEIAVYNERNRLVDAAGIHQMWDRYARCKFDVNDFALSLFRNALCHRSYVRGVIFGEKGFKRKKTDPIVDPRTLIRPPGVLELMPASYDRSEFRGDAAVHLALTDYIYERFPTQDEGFMTRLRAKIENGQQMARIAKKIGMGKWIIMSKQVDFAGGRTNDKILEDVFEASMDVLYKVYGFNMCKRIVYSILEKEIDIPSLLKFDDNYKDQLLRYYHQMRWPDPKYYGDDIPDDKNPFHVYVTDYKGGKAGRGAGPSKQKAEQLAAKRALQHFGLLGDTGEALMNRANMGALITARKIGESGEEASETDVPIKNRGPSPRIRSPATSSASPPQVLRGVLKKPKQLSVSSNDDSDGEYDDEDDDACIAYSSSASAPSSSLGVLRDGEKKKAKKVVSSSSSEEGDCESEDTIDDDDDACIVKHEPAPPRKGVKKDVGEKKTSSSSSKTSSKKVPEKNTVVKKKGKKKPSSDDNNSGEEDSDSAPVSKKASNKVSKKIIKKAVAAKKNNVGKRESSQDDASDSD